jgi:nitrite reductase (cytochrome c-552)
MEEPKTNVSRLRPVLPFLLAFGVIAAGTLGVMALRANIAQRKLEARDVVFRIVELDETTVDPAAWGKNFPRQYDHYRRTVDVVRTRYGGSEAYDKLEADPRLKEMWDGYAFATEFREERGHAYMLVDQRETERVTKFKQPGACLHCHASNTVAYRKVGLANGAPGALTDAFDTEAARAQLMKGFETVNPMPYAEATTHVEHPVACIDCHDPRSMQLRVTRPGFMNGIQALARSTEPVPHLPSVERWRTGDRKKPYDANSMASRQEMRSLVCGQCHVEYYFRGPEKLLTYPWHKGLKVEQVEAYYDEEGFSDWTHAKTGAGVLKAQHPEFEMWSQGIHAKSGVACADCHMPYMREGAVKISDHHVRSPALAVNRSCQPCHSISEANLIKRVDEIQGRTKALMSRSQDALSQAIVDIARARAGTPDAEAVKQAQRLQRRAQFRIDFVNAENSMGFHAPQETARILGEAIDFARQAQLALYGAKLIRPPEEPTSDAASESDASADADAVAAPATPDSGAGGAAP